MVPGFVLFFFFDTLKCFQMTWNSCFFIEKSLWRRATTFVLPQHASLSTVSWFLLAKLASCVSAESTARPALHSHTQTISPKCLSLPAAGALPFSPMTQEGCDWILPASCSLTHICAITQQVLCWYRGKEKVSCLLRKQYTKCLPNSKQGKKL